MACVWLVLAWYSYMLASSPALVFLGSTLDLALEEATGRKDKDGENQQQTIPREA